MIRRRPSKLLRPLAAGRDTQPTRGDKTSGDKTDTAMKDARRDLQQTLARARIMAGDAEAPLAQAQDTVDARRHAGQPARLRAVVDDGAARLRGKSAIGDSWSHNAEYAPVALRLLGLIEFQEGHLDAATPRFAELVRDRKVHRTMRSIIWD